MDKATKRDLKKQDQFVTATSHGLEWASRNRRSAIVTSLLVLAAILLLVGGAALYNHRSDKASAALGAAMQVYQTPVASAGQQVPPGTKTFATTKERAAAANKQFVDIADHYGMTKDGKIAQYFAGLTYMEEDQNQTAEDTLKKVASSWNGDLSALGKLSLAQLYRQTGRDAQAAGLYDELAKGHANTVPPGMAKIELAEMYEAEGKKDDAKKIYAQLKDSDKDDKGKPGPVGQLATQKLAPPAVPGGPGL